MITINGRPACRQQITSERYPNAVTVVVRFDDERNAEYWQEVRLNRVDLEAMLQHMYRLEADEREAQEAAFPVPAGWDHV